MFILPFLLAAGSLPLISGAPVASHLSRVSADVGSGHLLKARGTTYQAVYAGNGEVSDGWPAMTTWVKDFETMWESNKALIADSCGQFGVQNPSEQEMADTKAALQSIGTEANMDLRFILAIMMQESKGCVRAPTTSWSVPNPGLMQSYNGTGSCNNGVVKDPCPNDEIVQMIKDGVTGKNGLVACRQQYGGTDTALSLEKTARCYNSGSVASSGNLGFGAGTACYVSDVINRLEGWTEGESECTTSQVQSDSTSTNVSGSGSSSDLSGSSWSSSSSSDSVAPASSTVPVASQYVQPTTSSTVWAAAETPSSAAVVDNAPAVTESPQATWSQPTTSRPLIPAASTVAPSAVPSSSGSALPIYPEAISSCKQYAGVQEGDYCQKIEQQYGITAAQFISWNTGLLETCSNLWKGYRYCVSA